jgi:hypothetical protein
MAIYISHNRKSMDSRKCDFGYNDNVLLNKSYNFEEKENREIGVRGLGNGSRVNWLRLGEYAAR